jgi:hypothetical protein
MKINIYLRNLEGIERHFALFSKGSTKTRGRKVTPTLNFDECEQLLIALSIDTF